MHVLAITFQLDHTSLFITLLQKQFGVAILLPFDFLKPSLNVVISIMLGMLGTHLSPHQDPGTGSSRFQLQKAILYSLMHMLCSHSALQLPLTHSNLSTATFPPFLKLSSGPLLCYAESLLLCPTLYDYGLQPSIHIQMDISFLFSFAFHCFSAIQKASSDNHFAFLHFFLLGMI